MARPRLRTKTGCLTCRKRRVKCDEEKPWCRNCFTASRHCEWPEAKDAYDKRHRGSMSSHNSLRRISPKESCNLNLYNEVNGIVLRSQKLLDSSRSSDVRSALDAELIHHYREHLLSVLLVPNVHAGFYTDYCSRITDMVLSSAGVRLAVLACCASNKYMLTNDSRYHRFALSYYTQAVEEVNLALQEVDLASEAPSDTLIIAVTYLYIYALWGSDAAIDAPKHVKGAMQLLSLRYDDRLPLSMARPFDRITTESVLYQAFLLAMRNPFSPSFHVDTDFLMRTESMLKAPTFTNVSAAENSPVLGVPVPLYRLILDIIECFSAAELPDCGIVTRLVKEMQIWETRVVRFDMTDHDTPEARPPGADTVVLYVLAASLLLEWVTELCGPGSPPSNGDPSKHFPSRSRKRPPCSCSWQLEYALSILRMPENLETWTRCYLGLWPLLVFGHAVDADADIEFIAQLLKRMRSRTGYGEVQRILDELELVWKVKKRESMIPSHALVGQA